MLLLCVDIHNENRSYTDNHDVDEDARTIESQGGSWPHGSYVGIALRDMEDSPTETYGTVASLKNIGHSR